MRPVNAPKPAAEGLLVLVFEDLRGGRSCAKNESRALRSSPALYRLEDELRATNEDLRNTVEEAEDARLALGTYNEEVMSLNEELQSANEELESSKEELHSLNEELIAINSQLTAKVEDLNAANTDMANLMSATGIPMVFLDQELRIKSFTASARTLLNLLETDVGCAFGDIARKFDDSPVVQDARQAIETGATVERAFRLDQAHSYLRRILPHRPPGGNAGVVLTFIDITRQIEADAKLRRFAAVLHNSEDAIMVTDLDGRVVAWNRAAERFYGYGESEALKLSIRDLATQYAPTLDSLRQPSPGQSAVTVQTQRGMPDGRVLDISATIALLRDDAGNPEGFAITERDITISRRAEEARQLNVLLEQRVAERTSQLRRSEEQVRAIIDTTADAVITFETDGHVVTFNKAAEQVFGYRAEEILGLEMSLLIPLDEDGHAPQQARSHVSRIGALIGGTHEVVGHRKGGVPFPVRLLINVVAGHNLLVAFARDMTEYKAMQKEIVDIAVLEQRRIGEELHDGTQQELVGLGLIAQGLSEALQRNGMAAQSKLATRLARGLADANQHLRAIVNGMVPVPVDREGLMAALSALARRTHDSFELACHFDCPRPVTVDSDREATHLFRLAQEAVNNAVQHAEASEIRIRLEHVNGQLRVEVLDDGLGFEARHARSKGVGLRLMAHRCEIVGGSFAIESGEAGGSRIVCALPGNSNG